MNLVEAIILTKNNGKVYSNGVGDKVWYEQECVCFKENDTTVLYTGWNEYVKVEPVVVPPVEITLPEKVKSFRKKYDLSQVELAGFLGVSKVTVYRMENGIEKKYSDYIIRKFELLEKTGKSILDIYKKELKYKRELVNRLIKAKGDRISLSKRIGVNDMTLKNWSKGKTCPSKINMFALEAMKTKFNIELER